MGGRGSVGSKFLLNNVHFLSFYPGQLGKPGLWFSFTSRAFSRRLHPKRLKTVSTHTHTHTTHTPTDGGVSHAGRQPGRREQAG